MPKIFEYFGYVFFFYSNEHEPIHVHVIHGACQVVFELIIDSGNLVEIRRRMLKGYEQMSEKNMLEAEKFKYHLTCSMDHMDMDRFMFI